MIIREELQFVICEMDPYISKESVPEICLKLDKTLMSCDKDFIIDMWEAKTLNSSMASVIIHILKYVSKGGHALHIVNISNNVLNAFNTLHLTDIAKIHETALDFEIATGVEIRSLSH